MSLEEVARRAGVSTATVSRVLNDLDIVKSSTKARVLRAIKELNYYPNLHARTLAGGKSRTIGLIVSNLENPFFFDIYHALEVEAHRNGYEVVAANTGYSPARLVSFGPHCPPGRTACFKISSAYSHHFAYRNPPA